MLHCFTDMKSLTKTNLQRQKGDQWLLGMGVEQGLTIDGYKGQ